MSASASTDTYRVAVVTLGCGRNEVDSEQLAGLFHREGNAVVDDPLDADVVLVNTCTFIAPAKQESIDTVLEACQLKDEGSARAVLVVGCMAQRYPHELAEAIPEADAIVGFDGYATLPSVVGDVLAGRQIDRVVGVGDSHPGARPVRRDLPLMVAPVGASPTAHPPSAPVTAPVTTPERARSEPSVPSTAADLDELALGLRALELPPEAPRTALAPGTAQDLLDRVPDSGPRFPVRLPQTGGVPRPWAYLKIASGCDRICTFCAIPSFRGRFRSRPLDEVLAEAAWLVEGGARELVLVSENTTSWGKDLPGGRRLQATLLRELSAIDDLERLRLMYLQPAELTLPLLETMAELPKVASYFDLSLQHVSGPVVQAMARSGDPERFGALIERIRGLDPQAVFRSNFILGFPGETEADVAALETFLAEHVLDWVGLFPFSVEDGTPSADFDAQVPAEVAEHRLARVGELQERLADEASRRFVGRELDVIVQERPEDGDEEIAATLARSYREAPDTDGEIEVVDDQGRAADLAVGARARVQVIDTVGVDLVARLVEARA
ncbi:MiaB/RimO family radical SAM methylthiotransferase [Egicoccus halophilus]|uniref:Ribosomal protein uS12 methylthiotransferase RimO n=1 Tax=Egicoccus halophilus TaxID=1670830 RepID=A0A8J3AAR4_9ACTN|nr:radical SAM protein [Egicoccus halophilus]GGI06588.1 ribosomal protein S12 methylthiotransferase RimO [Egicoccus halophilus]